MKQEYTLCSTSSNKRIYTMLQQQETELSSSNFSDRSFITDAGILGMPSPTPASIQQ